MHIVLVGTRIGPTLNFRGALIARCVNAGHTVTVLATDYSDPTRAQVLSLGAVPCDNPLNRASFNPFADIKGCMKLYRLFKHLQPDCVFSFFVKPVIFGTIAAKIARVKRIIVMIEGLGYFFTKRPLPDSILTRLVRTIQVWLYAGSLPLADHVIVLNSDDQKDLIHHYKIRVKALSILGGIGVPLSLFPYSPIAQQEYPQFLFVGRLLADKGIFEFIKAAYIVKKRYPQTRFKIVGDIDPHNPASLTSAQFNQLKDEKIIELCGFQEDIKRHLTDCSVFVLPSYREGVPLCVQEAMSVGRPIITSFVPGCKETIVNGVSGFFVEPFSVDALVEKMHYFTENPEKISQMGSSAHDRATQIFNRDDKDASLLRILEMTVM